MEHDWNLILESLLNKEKISENIFSLILNEISFLLFNEGPFLDLSSPIYVCGDIHGQYYDLLNIIDLIKINEGNKILFLGDYVDRGNYSIETLALLFLSKLIYPESIYLLRGNHESSDISSVYGFYDEIIQSFGHSGTWIKCMEVFEFLPIVARIDFKYLAVHGGLSPNLIYLQQIALLQHPTSIEGFVKDLLWSDPETCVQDWELNPRGAGYLFGSKPVQNFLFNNSLSTIIRSHQLQMEGFDRPFNDDSLFTIWSAPNYMYRAGNKSCIFKIIDNSNYDLIYFESTTPIEKSNSNIPIPIYFM